MLKVKIDSEQIKRLEKTLGKLEPAVKQSIKDKVKEYAEYFAKRVSFYIGKTSRSTGTLKKSIETNIASNGYHATVSIGKGLTYAAAVNYGISRVGYIYPKNGEALSFEASSWRTHKITKLQRNGKYVFAKVRIGKRKGKLFWEKALRDLTRKFIKEYDKMSEVVQNALGNIIGL